MIEKLYSIRLSYWHNFRNDAVMNNNITQVKVERKKNVEFWQETSEGIIELNVAQQVQLQNFIKRKIKEPGLGLKPKNLDELSIDV